MQEEGPSVQLDEKGGVTIKPSLKTVPISPSPLMEEEHNAVGHVVFRNWCRHCIMARTAIDPHYKAPEPFIDAVDELHPDFMYMGDDDSDLLLPILVMKDKRTKKSYCSMLESKGTVTYTV